MSLIYNSLKLASFFKTPILFYFILSPSSPLPYPFEYWHSFRQIQQRNSLTKLCPWAYFRNFTIYSTMHNETRCILQNSVRSKSHFLVQESDNNESYFNVHYISLEIAQ